jgi:hypothetical protein
MLHVSFGFEGLRIEGLFGFLLVGSFFVGNSVCSCVFFMCTWRRLTLFIFIYKIYNLYIYKVVGYDFIIECKKGCDNSAVDALSRRHESGDLLAIS